uniref:Uncharacterized protein n=1 Tax=uncultured marine group II/III euryarchaeote KM3_05_H10 TaxID=1457839 RepID=A0A075G987_9EURY|nr:hypothetical protein [uncultured marine group II/III euryarchaeote KM3_05_H10]
MPHSVNRIAFAIGVVMALLLAGCLTAVREGDDVIILDNPEQLPESLPPVEVRHDAGCDDLNPIHCLLPFPSDAFLAEDATTTTGFRVNYSDTTLPGTGLMPHVEIAALNRFDGITPSTQIMTAFTTVPDLTGAADQYSIGDSLAADHPTILLNLDTGERVAHWVEVDARADRPTATIVFVRTLGALDYDTSYGVAFSGLTDTSADPIQPSDALRAIIEGNVTTSPDIESRRPAIDSLLDTLAAEGYARENVQAAWKFHTASHGSILGGMLAMRSDALDRLGEQGIGCNVTSAESNYGDDNKIFMRIHGTFTAPQYLESQEPPTLLNRSEDGTPEYVEDAEIPFTMVIPQVLADLNESGPLVVFGHGFLGTGEGTSDYVIGWAEEYKVSFVATDLYGWSSSDVGTLELGVVNPIFFQHQAERLQQALINKMSMIRTFKGVCSDLAEMQHNGTNLVDSTDVHYMGYSLGGIYGSSVVAISPDIDRAALWVGGSGFSTMVERSTNFAPWVEGFSSFAGYPQRNDRALLVGVIQQLWSVTDPETYLPFANSGYNGPAAGDVLGPFNFLSIISVNDAQVPALSSDRAARTAGVPVLDSSARLPHGLTPAAGPITGSAVVYWDGGYPTMPDDNSAPPLDQSSKAHNEIGPIEAVNDMVRDFLLTGIINDTCADTCTFDYAAESAE